MYISYISILCQKWYRNDIGKLTSRFFASRLNRYFVRFLSLNINNSRIILSNLSFSETIIPEREILSRTCWITLPSWIIFEWEANVPERAARAQKGLLSGKRNVACRIRVDYDGLNGPYFNNDKSPWFDATTATARLEKRSLWDITVRGLSISWLLSYR